MITTRLSLITVVAKVTKFLRKLAGLKSFITFVAIHIKLNLANDYSYKTNEVIFSNLKLQIMIYSHLTSK